MCFHTIKTVCFFFFNTAYCTNLLCVLLVEDIGFDDSQGVRDSTSMEDGFENSSFNLFEGPSKETLGNSSPVASTSRALDAPLKDDGFGGTVGEGLLGMQYCMFIYIH